MCCCYFFLGLLNLKVLDVFVDVEYFKVVVVSYDKDVGYFKI